MNDWFETLSQMGAGLTGTSSYMPGGGMANAQAQMNMSSLAQSNLAQAQAAQNAYDAQGFDRLWSLDYSHSYDQGRESAWLAPLRDPGAIVLRIAGYLVVYPAVYVLFMLLRGLFNALF